MKLNELITSRNTSVNKDTIPAIYTKLAKQKEPERINIDKDLQKYFNYKE